MNKPSGRVFIYDWPTGSGKTLEVLNTILKGKSQTRTIRAILDRTAIFTPSLGMRQAWVRDLGIFLLGKKIKLFNSKSGNLITSEDEWRKLPNPTRIQILFDLNLFPKFWTFKDFNKRIRKPTNHGDCWHLVMDEWHRVGKRRKDQFLKILDGSVINNRWWNLLNTSKKVNRDIYLCSATPLNPVNESKLEEKSDMSDDSDESLLREELKRAIGLISVLSGREEKQGATLWKDLASNRIKLVSHPHEESLRWKLPIMPEHSALKIPPNVLRQLRNIRKKEVQFINDTLNSSKSYMHEYRYCQGIIKTKYKAKKHWVSSGGQTSFGLPYEQIHHGPTSHVSNKNKKQRAEAWLMNANGRVLRLLILLDHFKVIALKSQKSQHYPFSITPLKEKVVIFCSHQATAKGLYYTLKKIMPESMHNAISTTFMRSKRNQSRKTNNEVIKQFNFDDHLKILITTDAFSESYDLHQNCRTVIHYEIPWSPHRLFQRVGRVTRLLRNAKGDLICNEGCVGHVIIPGSAEEEQIQRLKRRISLLSEHQLLPGIRLKDKEDKHGAFARYLGIGPGWGAQPLAKASNAKG